MSFPISPTDGQTTQVNGIYYVYQAANNKWTRTLSPLANISLVGNITTGNANIYTQLNSPLGTFANLYITSGLFWANGISIPATSGGGGGGGSPTGSQGQLQYNEAGTFGATTVFYDNATGNLVITDTTDSTSITSGGLVIKGGVGVSGNVFASTVYATTGLKWASNGVPINSSYTTSSSVPLNPAVGDQWYDTGDGVVYQYLNDGTSAQWVDVSSPTFLANSGNTTRAFYGNVSFDSNVTAVANITSGNLITGNLTSNTIVVSSNLQAQNAVLTSNLTVNNVLTVNGGIIGGGYVFEKATITATAPPASVDIDLLTSSIIYWTGNATINTTANIRGNATVPLNSLLSTGQSTTAVLFYPQGSSNYCINVVKVDNTNVLINWQGSANVAAGNSNSVDVYTLSIVKTGSATFKVFASQSQFLHTG